MIKTNNVWYLMGRTLAPQDMPLINDGCGRLGPLTLKN